MGLSKAMLVTRKGATIDKSGFSFPFSLPVNATQPSDGMTSPLTAYTLSSSSSSMISLSEFLLLISLARYLPFLLERLSVPWERPPVVSFVFWVLQPAYCSVTIYSVKAVLPTRQIPFNTIFATIRLLSFSIHFDSPCISFLL